MTETTEIKWLVGLGNPGAGYAGHRHNIGFRLLDALRDHGDFTPWQAAMQKQAMVATGELKGELKPSYKLQLIKPMAYMNLSGQVVQGAIAKSQEKMTIGNIMELHDEIDLPFGQIKIKFGGGEAGHNGLKDISARLGRDYHRVRFGVGHPGDKNLVSDFVLQNFAKDEEEKLSQLIPLLAKDFYHLLAGDKARFLDIIAKHRTDILGA